MTNENHRNAVIVLDAPAESLSDGTKMVVNKRIQEVINSGGDNGESVDFIRWSDTHEAGVFTQNQLNSLVDEK